VHDGQPEAGALAGRLAGVEQVEDLAQRFLRDADAVVLDLHHDAVGYRNHLESNDAQTACFFFHRVDGILGEIDEDLLQQHGVGEHGGDLGGVLALDLTTGQVDLWSEQVERFVQQVGDRCLP